MTLHIFLRDVRSAGILNFDDLGEALGEKSTYSGLVHLNSEGSLQHCQSSGLLLLITSKTVGGLIDHFLKGWVCHVRAGLEQ